MSPPRRPKGESPSPQQISGTVGPPAFRARDPSTAEFWDERYAAQFTPWEVAGLPATFEVLAMSVLSGLLEGQGPHPRRVLVPGCGNGHEMAWLLAQGADALGVDLSPAAVALARQRLPDPQAAERIQQADFFALDAAPFDWIYERAFVAALPSALWPRWAAQCARLTRPGALLAGYFFLDPSPPAARRGPPFVASLDELDLMLGLAFRRLRVIAIDPTLSAPVFAGREHWVVWRRQ